MLYYFTNTLQAISKHWSIKISQIWKIDTLVSGGTKSNCDMSVSSLSCLRVCLFVCLCVSRWTCIPAGMAAVPAALVYPYDYDRVRHRPLHGQGDRRRVPRADWFAGLVVRALDRRGLLSHWVSGRNRRGYDLLLFRLPCCGKTYCDFKTYFLYSNCLGLLLIKRKTEIAS